MTDEATRAERPGLEPIPPGGIPHDSRRHDPLDELANALTHGFGFLLSLVGLPFLITMAVRYGDAWHVTSCAVYAASVLCLYAASTAYHAVRDLRWKVFFRTVDHICIYLLIAGTYTPFTLVSLRGDWGWTLFATIWGLAIFGIVFKVVWTGRSERVSLLTYVGMGWLAVLAARPLYTHLPAACLLWIAAGGAAYTAGIIFYVRDRIRYMHAAWHLFVIAGSACHYIAIIGYVLPAEAWA